MAVKWTSDFAVGNVVIDQQHQELFRRFGALVDACKERRGKEKVRELLLFLDEYVVTHFGEEEALMVRHGYPDLEEHRREHRKFIETLESLKSNLAGEGVSFTLLVETNEAVLQWLIHHIRKIDTRLGSFLSGRA